MNKKYELTEETIVHNGKTLYRIKALKDFGYVKKGDFGGFVQGEHNLSHDGNCWIYDNAIVCNNARASGNAIVSGNVEICDNAIVCNNAIVRDNAIVCNRVLVCNNAVVRGNAIVRDNARVSDNDIVGDNTEVYDDAIVRDNAEIRDDAVVGGNVEVRDNAKVCNNAIVFGRAVVCNNAKIRENAYIENNNDFLCIGQIGSRNDYTTFYLDQDKNIHVSCGCFNGTIDKFEKAVEKTHGDNKYGKQYKIAIETVERMLALDN